MCKGQASSSRSWYESYPGHPGESAQPSTSLSGFVLLEGGEKVDGKVYSHLTHRLVGVAGTEGAPPTAEMTCEGTGRTEATAEVAEATGAGSEVAEATALLTAEVAEATAPVAVEPEVEDIIIEDIMEEVVDSSVEL